MEFASPTTYQSLGLWGVQRSYSAERASYSNKSDPAPEPGPPKEDVFFYYRETKSKQRKSEGSVRVWGSRKKDREANVAPSFALSVLRLLLSPLSPTTGGGGRALGA